MKQECGTIAQYLKQSITMVFHVPLEQNCRVGKRQRHVLLRDVEFIFVTRLSCQVTLVSTLIAIQMLTVRVDTPSSNICSLLGDHFMWHVFLLWVVRVRLVISLFDPLQHVLVWVHVPNRVPTVLALLVFIGVSIYKPTSQPLRSVGNPNV